jgi:ubiquinone/menaquinone biosynthesis C-methylase UbiE
MKSKQIKEIPKSKLMPSSVIKIDFGCGPNKQPGFIGVDQIAFPNVDVVMNVGKDKWKWKDNTVEEAYASHFVEHLEAIERVHFINELYRVLKPGAKCQIITPHWASMRAYGDLTHKWPPVCEFWFYYLSKEWRAVNAPHSQYNESVNFACTWGYSMRQDLLARNQEYQQFSLENYKEACQDTIATLVKQ